MQANTYWAKFNLTLKYSYHTFENQVPFLIFANED